MTDTRPIAAIHDKQGKWSGAVKEAGRLPKPEEDPDEIRAFMRVVHRALRMICSYIERRYSL